MGFMSKYGLIIALLAVFILITITIYMMYFRVKDSSVISVFNGILSSNSSSVSKKLSENDEESEKNSL